MRKSCAWVYERTPGVCPPVSSLCARTHCASRVIGLSGFPLTAMVSKPCALASATVSMVLETRPEWDTLKTTAGGVIDGTAYRSPCSDGWTPTASPVQLSKD